MAPKCHANRVANYFFYRVSVKKLSDLKRLLNCGYIIFEPYTPGTPTGGTGNFWVLSPTYAEIFTIWDDKSGFILSVVLESQIRDSRRILAPFHNFCDDPYRTDDQLVVKINFKIFLNKWNNLSPYDQPSLHQLKVAHREVHILLSRRRWLDFFVRE